jgi:hypothetical protein
VLCDKNVLERTGGNNIKMLSKEICPQAFVLYLGMLLTFLKVIALFLVF